MSLTLSRPNDRLRAALLAGVIQAVLGYALIMGLAVHMAPPSGEPLTLFGIAPEPPPPPIVKVQPRPSRSHRPEGAASPPNLRSKATEIVAPPPVIPLVIPPLVVAAPDPGVGRDASAGAADVAGPGTGSGGIGDGTGSGGAGDGDGGGSEETPPRWIKGRLKDSDFPAGLGDAGVGGTVGVRYTVAVTGRVSACTVTRSSGNAVLDETTCRLIRDRFRFRPSLDAANRPVASVIVEKHEWINELAKP